MREKLLVVELWGIGDLVMATAFLQVASEKFDVTLVAKPYALDLQRRFWPDVEIIPFVAPWTAFDHKYRLLSWNWHELNSLLKRLRTNRYDVGVSARWDPRDHVLLWASGTRRRIGFPRSGSAVFLHQNLPRPFSRSHRSEYWRAAAKALDLNLPTSHAKLNVRRVGVGSVTVHTGAGQPVRVWPLERFRNLVQTLRSRGMQVNVVCDPPQTEWWQSVGESSVRTPRSVTDLISLLEHTGVFIGNDSGPGHLAAIMGIPTFTLFGPQLPELFHPMHLNSEWIEGAPCRFKPCSDSCRFPVPTCLHELSESSVLNRVEKFIINNMCSAPTSYPTVSSDGISIQQEVASSGHGLETKSSRIHLQIQQSDELANSNMPTHRHQSNPLSISISLADQRFDQVKSLGILGTSLGLARVLATSREVHRLTLFTNPTLPKLSTREGGPVLSSHLAGNRGGKLWRLWWDQFGVYQAARNSSNKWLLLPKGYASFLRRCPVKLATYVHDVGPEYYRQRHPKGYPPMEVTYFHAGLRAAIAQSKVILVNTQSTAGEIRALAARLCITCPPVQVVGIGFEPPTPAPPLNRTRILTLANRWPHKRTDLALEFLSRWQRTRNFSGEVDWVGSLPEGVSFPSFSNWRLHQRLPQQDFEFLLRQARAFVYLSDYEGFGMPPVESTLAGACPVYSNLPSTREVMDGAGFAFSNADFNSFASALDASLRVSQQTISCWAEELLARHNWQSVLELTIRALNSVEQGTGLQHSNTISSR